MGGRVCWSVYGDVRTYLMYSADNSVSLHRTSPVESCSVVSPVRALLASVERGQGKLCHFLGYVKDGRKEQRRGSHAANQGYCACVAPSNLNIGLKLAVTKLQVPKLARRDRPTLHDVEYSFTSPSHGSPKKCSPRIHNYFARSSHAITCDRLIPDRGSRRLRST